MGEYDRALKVAKKCGPGIEANSLQLVAYHEALAGHADWALVWAERLDNPEDRARTFLGIATGIIEKATGKEEDFNE